MQNIRKKTRRSLTWWQLLLLALVLLGLVLAATQLLGQDAPAYTDEELGITPSTALTLYHYDPLDVTSMTIRYGDDGPWTLVQESPGLMTLQGENGFTLSKITSWDRMYAASVIPCVEVLSSNPAEYATRLADFGLAEPVGAAQITYADGVTVSLRIGDTTAHDATSLYMLIDGDDRLFTFNKSIAEDLFVQEQSLRDVTQPTLHKARIDRISLLGPDGQLQTQWTLQGQITDSDALDRWQVTYPLTYPADATAMNNLLKNAANLRLGAYVAPATPENLALYGFDQPRLTIDIHQAAGTIGTAGLDGAYTTTDWPESSCTFVIGGARSDLVDYVLHGGDIYVSSHFTMGVFMDIDVRETMSRYLLPTALGNLDALTIEQNGVTDVFTVIRTEQVAPNNDLMYDEEGDLLYDVSCTRNGEPFDYTVFEAAYTQLMLTSAAGVLPEDAVIDASAHTCYTFRDVDGTTHTVELATFEAFHDAVTIDGQQVFYIPKGGFKLNFD